MPKILLERGFQLHYQQVGRGPDLVMIHGLTGNLAVWHLKIIPMLWDHFRILTYDLRGHGYSEAPPTGYAADDMAEDLREVLDTLEIEQPAIVGHSYGADIALYFALSYPMRVKQVVAIEAALPAMIHLRNREDWEGWTYWEQVLANSGQHVPPDRRTDVDYLLRLSMEIPKKWGPLNGLPRNPKPFLRLLDTTTVARDYEQVGRLTLDKIPSIQSDVLLLYSEKSAFLGTYHYLAEHLPHVQEVLLPKSDWGHFGPLEQPELVAEQLLAFLTPAFTGVGADVRQR
jgi:pimeloyl-ACP methyl ester carboxylesterase